MYRYTHDPSTEQRTVIKSFGGLNEDGNAEVGEFSSINEFTSENYPALKTRKKHRIGETLQGGAPAVFVGDSAQWVTRDGTLHANGTESANFASELVGDEKRSAVMLGSVAVIFPDNVWTNTANGEKGEIDFERSLPSTGNTLKVTLEFDDGTVPEAQFYMLSEPITPVNGELWCSKQQNGEILAQRYYSDGEMWLPQNKIRYRFTSPGISEGIVEGDYVKIGELYAGTKRIEAFEKEYRVSSVRENSITVDAEAEIWIAAHVCHNNPHEYAIDSMKLTRSVPDLQYVCSCGNRLWGCSSDGHEIRSTALGSFSSWERFDGNETDCWAATVGSPGTFTGCAVWDGNPVFFKENELIRVFGNKPSNFGISYLSCVGIERGSRFSPACVRGVLYYKGADGFYMWNGGVPEKVSRGMRGEYGDVCGAALGDKYYAAVTDKSGKRRLLIYDTVRGTWHASSLEAVSLCTVGCELYAVCEGEEEGEWNFVSVDRIGTGNSLDPVTFTEEDDVEWSAVTGDLLGSTDRTYVREIDIGYRLEKGASLGVYMLADSSERPVLLGHITGNGKRADCTLTVSNSVCRRFSLKFTGKGEFTLYTLSLRKNAI